MGVDPLVDEGVIRILGELSAVGLDVEVLRRTGETQSDVGPLQEGTYGLIRIHQRGHLLLVEAWAPDGANPSSLEVATNEPDITAEVVAVRAVELLRAKWLEYGELSGAALPDLVMRFARAEGVRPDPRRNPLVEPEQQAAPEPPTPAQSAPEPPAYVEPRVDTGPPPPAQDEPGGLLLQLAGGPSFEAEARHVMNLALGGQLLIGASGLFGGVGVDGSLTPIEFAESVGTASISKSRVLGVLRAELDLASSWRGFLELGGGVARYSIDATADDTTVFFAIDSVEHRLVGAVRIGTSAWLHRSLGLYAVAELNGLARSLAIRMDERPIETLGAPSGSLGLGLNLRYPLPL
jgi:hypothetical protein